MSTSSDTFRKQRKVIPYEKTQIGAIRWDVWNGTRSACELNSLIAEDDRKNKIDGKKEFSITKMEMMMRTLSYYPSRAPYFVNYEGKQENGDITISIQSCYEKTGKTYKVEDVMDDLSVKEHPYLYGVSWEEEATMAMDAGIDYFAYLYRGRDGDRLNQVYEPALAHTALNGMLPDGRQMKMVCILQDNPTPLVDIDMLETEAEKLDAIIYARRMIYKAMAQSCYLDAHTQEGDIPILHFYWEEMKRMAAPERLEYYKKEARFYTRYLHARNPHKYRVVDDIYCVAYHIYKAGDSVAEDFGRFNRLGFDAISRYAVSATVTAEDRAQAIACIQKTGLYDTPDREYHDVLAAGTNVQWQRLHRIDECCDQQPSIWVEAFGEDYGHYMEKVDRLNELCREQEQLLKHIPTVSLGFNVAPRMKVRVSWIPNYYKGNYVQTGTPDQLAEQLRRGLEYVSRYNDDFENSTNTINIYAWNEFDEGGYLQPTITIGDDGEIVRNEDGTPKKNDEILTKCADVIKAYRETEKMKLHKRNRQAR